MNQKTMRKMVFLFLFVFIFLVSGMMTSRPSHAFERYIGGRKLYQLGFIQGSDPNKMVLNETDMFTREQLAVIILEIMGLKEKALKASIEPEYSDAADISKWARPFVAYCQKMKLMSGMDQNTFQPKGYVTGKQLGAVLLRALGYTRESGREIPWSDVEKTFEKFELPITNWGYHASSANLSISNLTRGDAFDLIWYTITYPICADGEVLAMKLGKIKPREVIFLGEYEQDGNLENGKEPIEWIILEKREGKALITSRYGLDSKRYHDHCIGRNEQDFSWKESSIRKWLNQEFYHKAFREDEQKRIRLSYVENRNVITPKDTLDRVFLLDHEDVDTYFVSNYERCLIATPYALNNIVKNIELDIDLDYGNCFWVLRDVVLIAQYDNYVQYSNYVIQNSGYTWFIGNDVCDDSNVIRPAMWIQLDD